MVTYYIYKLTYISSPITMYRFDLYILTLLFHANFSSFLVSFIYISIAVVIVCCCYLIFWRARWHSFCIPDEKYSLPFRMMGLSKNCVYHNFSSSIRYWKHFWTFVGYFDVNVASFPPSFSISSTYLTLCASIQW